MSADPLTSFRLAAIGCVAVMLESAGFIERELASMEAVQPYRQAIKKICDTFAGNWFDIRAELDEMSELQLPAYAPMTAVRVARIYKWLSEDLPALQGVVLTLDSAAKHDPACGAAHVLIAACAVNVLTVVSAVADAHANYVHGRSRETGC